MRSRFARKYADAAEQVRLTSCSSQSLAINGGSSGVEKAGQKRDKMGFQEVSVSVS